MPDPQTLHAVVFRVGDLLCAAPAGIVREILPVLQPTRIPGVAEAVDGLVNVRGALLTVLDAHRLLARDRSSADEGAIVVGGPAFKHVFPGRHGGTTSFGAWGHTNGEWGVMFQNDERIYSHPGLPDDGRGLNLITRFSWSKTTTFPPLYFGASLAWHGLWARDNDTVGVGFGYFTKLGGGDELFFEAFYKARLTHWFSVQPDVQLYRIDGVPTVLLGLRLKLKV